MPITSASMVINSSIMVRSRPPTKYITQSAEVCWGGGVGGGVVVADSWGGDSVVKAPTELQAL